MDLSEQEVDAAVLGLRERGLARSVKPTGSRGWKHRQVVTEVLPLDDAEIAVLAVLGLRDAQTPGELRQRSERLFPFDSVEAVEDTLELLASRVEPLSRNLGREPGQSQDRWVLCLGESAVSAEQSRQRAHAASFRALHESGFFAMPNPWDRGSAKMMQDAGALALATTSAGHGRAIGKDDQLVTRDELVSHVADLTSFINVPLNVDSERLFPAAPGGIARTVQLLAEAGAAGVSIEDYNPTTSSIDSLNAAIEAVAIAATECARHDLFLTARAENHLYGIDDLDNTIERLQHYRDAGADCLYAPGLRDLDEISLLVDAVVAPVNVLAFADGPSNAQLATAGVRRASSGSIIFAEASKAARRATTAFLDTVRP